MGIACKSRAHSELWPTRAGYPRPYSVAEDGIVTNDRLIMLGPLQKSLHAKLPVIASAVVQLRETMLTPSFHIAIPCSHHGEPQRGQAVSLHNEGPLFFQM